MKKPTREERDRVFGLFLVFVAAGISVTFSGLSSWLAALNASRLDYMIVMLFGIGLMLLAYTMYDRVTRSWASHQKDTPVKKEPCEKP